MLIYTSNEDHIIRSPILSADEASEQLTKVGEAIIHRGDTTVTLPWGVFMLQSVMGAWLENTL
jgi:hypothetical protein